ncbi:DUF4132 domain-containing protein [Clostridium sp. AWRP]|uniref:DUF4132 domain-containing protein n=1 Tax=Clostridium sp. AWRP TaxID=2212991 RepID=UPI000FD6FCC7|nr:DUF4132 domain-containing protein [Clostridium sp. AWRP]AZV59011.1 DUF4132 domain-containing protein [Clostridium sp. AWRP]
MNIKEHLLNKIEDVLEELNVSQDVLGSLEDYLEDEVQEDEFLNMLPEVDFNSISKDILSKAAKAYTSIRRYKSNEYIRKYINILFKMGKASVTYVILKSSYWISEYTVNELIKAGVEKYIVLIVYVNRLAYDYSRLDNKNFKTIYDICRESPEDVIKACEYLDVNQKMVVCSIYCKYKGIEKNDKYYEFLKDIEDDFTDSIDNLYDNKMPDDLVKKIQKFIEKNDYALLENIIDEVKGYKYSDYLFKFLVGFSALNADKSATLKQMFQFFVRVNFRDALNSAYSILPVTSCYSDTVNNMDMLFEIPSKYHVAWYAEKFAGNETASEILKKKLKEDKKFFEEAISLSEGASKNYLMSFMLDGDEKSNYIKTLEENCINVFSKVLREDKVNEGDISVVESFLRDDVSFKDVKNTLHSIEPQNTSYWRMNNELIEVLNILCKNLGGGINLYERVVSVMASVGYKNYIVKLSSDYKRNTGTEYSSEKFHKIFDILRKYSVSVMAKMKLIDNIINDYDYMGRKAASLHTVLKDIVVKDKEEVVKNIDNISADGRCVFLEYIFKVKREENIKVVLDKFGDGSKKVKEKIVEVFTNSSSNLKYMEGVLDRLKAKKQGEREVAIRILSKWLNEEGIEEERSKLIKECLNYTLEAEKSQKIRALLMEVLGIEQEGTDKEKLKGEEFIKDLLKGNKKKSLSWLEFDSLPKVRLEESNNYCEEDYLKAVLLCYSASNTIGKSVDGDRLVQKLNRDGLKLFANKVFDRWLEKGAEAKKRWVLGFSSIYGGEEIVMKLQKCINDWAKNSRGAIASQAVKALALNGSPSALLIVDGISRKFKFKQVKKAAAEALDFAAEQMGVDREELSDKVVPNLGFNVSGERIFDYGSRKFTVRLAADLSVEVYDQNEKKLKNLPSPGKKDDELKTKEARSEFRAFKKKLKNTISVQTTRMDLALSNERKWTKEAWIKLFVENPIMHKFSIGLIWGIYENSKLVDTFRYMEDGTFNTKDEDEFEVPEKSSIGLVHPLELSKEDLNIWKEQLEDYEIVQPIKQLDREVFTMTEEEKKMKYVDRFGGKIVNGLSLVGKIMNYGWYRGSIQDAGGYYEFYKEDNNLGIGVELKFEGLSVGYENEDTTIYILRFYNAGTVKRGSYIYDEVKEQHLLSLSQVPEKYFSEILYQVSSALSSSNTVNENWRNGSGIKL